MEVTPASKTSQGQWNVLLWKMRTYLSCIVRRNWFVTNPKQVTPLLPDFWTEAEILEIRNSLKYCKTFYSSLLFIKSTRFLFSFFSLSLCHSFSIFRGSELTLKEHRSCCLTNLYATKIWSGFVHGSSTDLPLVWIQSFPSLRLVAILRLKNPICLTIYTEQEGG